jgi:hypothetical protein
MNEIEMIPEVEDDKFNTLYDKNNPHTSKDENSIRILKSNNKFQFNEKILKEEIIAPFESKELIRQCDPIDSSKINNSLKLDIQNKQTSKTIKNSIEMEEHFKEQSRRNIRINSSTRIIENSDFKQTGCFSPIRKQEFGNNLDFDTGNILSEAQNYQSNRAEKIEKNIKYSARKKKVNLPLINSSRPNYNTKIDKKELSNIFDACKDMKRDPEINEKFNELMYKIVDLKNVIDAKSNSRFKISSAPSQIVKSNIGNKSVFERNVNNNLDNITFSKFPNFNKNKNVSGTLFSNAANHNCFNQENIRKNSNSKINNFNQKNSNKSLGNFENAFSNNQQAENKFSRKSNQNKKYQ